MKLIIESPIKAKIESVGQNERDTLIKELTYMNTANQHDVKRHYHNEWKRRQNPDAWKAELERLKSLVKRTLIFDDKYIRPGSIYHLQKAGMDIEVVDQIQYPTPRKVAWAKPLPFELHDYQENSWQALVDARHANVELCTGAGKSAIILKCCRETGFKTAIVAPSRSIFLELVEKFQAHLGRGQVGLFGDGKKKLGHRFTVCISDSLANVKPGTPEWKFFSELEMLAVDESHLWGAKELETVCHGVLGQVPYRFFFSGTQTRGDGAEKLLKSIIGKTVYSLTTAEAKNKGYICNHDYRIVEVESSNPSFEHRDAIEMKRKHFLRNTNICAFIAKLANAEALINKRQSLVLVDELDQIAMLLPMLRVPVAIAHSEKDKARLAHLGLEKVDPAESVEKFNKAEAMVLVGTNCITTGTNIYPTHNTFNWQGGSSEVKTKQGAVGRSVRFMKSNPWADKCTPKEISHIWDFDITDIEIMSKHLEDRIGCYADSESEIKRIKLNAKSQKTGGIR